MDRNSIWMLDGVSWQAGPVQECSMRVPVLLSQSGSTSAPTEAFCFNEGPPAKED